MVCLVDVHQTTWVNPKSTSNQSSKSCTVLQYPSKKVLQYPSRKVVCLVDGALLVEGGLSSRRWLVWQKVVRLVEGGSSGKRWFFWQKVVCLVESLLLVLHDCYQSYKMKYFHIIRVEAILPDKPPTKQTTFYKTNHLLPDNHIALRLVVYDCCYSYKTKCYHKVRIRAILPDKPPIKQPTLYQTTHLLPNKPPSTQHITSKSNATKPRAFYQTTTWRNYSQYRIAATGWRRVIGYLISCRSFSAKEPLITGLFCKILWVSFAEYCVFYRALLQKSPIILSILLTKATPQCAAGCLMNARFRRQYSLFYRALLQK